MGEHCSSTAKVGGAAADPAPPCPDARENIRSKPRKNEDGAKIITMKKSP